MIHQTAIIDKTAIIEDNVEIGPYVVIGKDVIIKSGTVIGSSAYLEYCEIGNNCKIFNSASVGTAPQDISYRDEPTRAYVGDGTVLREFVTVNRGTKKSQKTVIGKNCLFMTASHAAHDTRVSDNVILANCVALAGHVEVGEGAIIGGHVGVHQFSKIGRGTMVGAGAVVTMDIIPYATAQGDRAVLAGLNVIGMKRRQMTAQEINNIKQAYKILFMSKLLLEEALLQIEKIQSPHVKEIIDFIKNSSRAIARPK